MPGPFTQVLIPPNGTVHVTIIDLATNSPVPPALVTWSDVSGSLLTGYLLFANADDSGFNLVAGPATPVGVIRATYGGPGVPGYADLTIGPLTVDNPGFTSP